MVCLDDQLAELGTMAKDDLKDRWVKLTGRAVPQVSAKLLRLALAYELQAKALGGLSRKTKQRLDQVAAARTETRDIRPGMRLAREFGGKVHVVTIGDAGEILWNEREWRSLSEVPRAITGTRWSRPAFFGLKRKRTAAWTRSVAPSTPANPPRKGSSRTSTRFTPSARPARPTF